MLFPLTPTLVLVALLAHFFTAALLVSLTCPLPYMLPLATLSSSARQVFLGLKSHTRTLIGTAPFTMFHDLLKFYAKTPLPSKVEDQVKLYEMALASNDVARTLEMFASSLFLPCQLN